MSRVWFVIQAVSGNPDDPVQHSHPLDISRGKAKTPTQLDLKVVLHARFICVEALGWAKCREVVSMDDTTDLELLIPKATW